MSWIDVAGRLAIGFFVLAMVAGLVAVLLERFVTDEGPDERSDDEVRRDSRIHAEWPRRDEQGRR